MNCHKVIIPVAGYGTRRLPITKAIEKCMLPICNRPTVDYIVENCILGGITDVYFVVSNDFGQLKRYYSTHVDLEEYLDRRGKYELLEELQSLSHRKTNFHYIIQDPAGAYGTAVPIWLARTIMQPGERFAIHLGDIFMFDPGGPNDFVKMRQAIDESGAQGSILGIKMAPEALSRASSIETRPGPNGSRYLKHLVEGPPVGTAPSDIGNIFTCILDTNIFPYLEKTMEKPNARGEHFLTDAINDYALENDLVVIPATGQPLDSGNLPSWIEANNIVFKTYLK